jgi:ferric-dicitrate binding protein FerR (iron transport regulator)
MTNQNETRRDEIRELLAQAGSPPEIPRDDLAAIRTAAREEWRSAYASGSTGSPVFELPARKKAVTRPLLALAASLLVALALGWWWTNRSAPAPLATAASVDLVRGEVTVDRGDGSEETAAGDLLTVASTLRTATGLVALRLPSGHSVRLAGSSVATLLSPTRIALERGAVYVDSGGASGSGIEVQTPLGLVTEIGTQFEVRIGNGDGESVRVRVREGSVSLAHEGRSYSASVGQQLTIDQRGEVFRAAAPVRGDEWRWILEAAPGFDSEGRTLGDFLDWLARETGWEIQYADASLEQEAAAIGLSPQREGLTPIESLENVFLGSVLDYELRGETLVVVGPSAR